MRVGILGSGLMGGKLGTLFARVSHEVVFSHARSKEKLNQLARDAGRNARAGTPREAAHGADALLLAVHWSRIDDVLNQAGDLRGKMIISCSLPLNAANTELVLGHTISGAEALANKMPGAEVVAAFNNIPSEVLFRVFEARGKATPPSMVYCGDSQAGKDIAATLIRDVGFDPIDAGPLRMARYTEPFAVLVAQLAYGGTEGPRVGLPLRAVWAKRMTQQKRSHPKSRALLPPHPSENRARLPDAFPRPGRHHEDSNTGVQHGNQKKWIEMFDFCAIQEKRQERPGQITPRFDNQERRLEVAHAIPPACRVFPLLGQYLSHIISRIRARVCDMDFRNFRDSDRDHDRPFKYQCRLAFGERDQRTEAGWLFGGTKCASKLINVRPGLGKTAGVVLAWLAAIAGNMELPVRGVVNGGAVPPVAVGGKSLGCEALSTDCRRMGRSANTHESYTRGVLRLLDHYGPFCLAFFEAIFCAADMRASARAKCAHFSAQS